MRQIGTLPRTVNPHIFGDYLESLGIAHRINQLPEHWAIWVLDDDRLTTGKFEFEAYLKNPDDPRYVDAKTVAEAARKERDRLDRQYRKNAKSLSGSWDRANLRRNPVTTSLIAVCVILFLAEHFSLIARLWIFDNLLFFPRAVMGQPTTHHVGLDAILGGQVWRLLTPALLHGDILHIAFNMWALQVLGTLIEGRKGSRFLLGLVLVSAVVSNLGQYLYVINFSNLFQPWVGFSGVAYALFGYIWMKGRLEPEQGMMLHPRSVQIMLVWLLFGFTPMANFANGAHVLGLLIGVLYGLARL